MQEVAAKEAQLVKPMKSALVLFAMAFMLQACGQDTFDEMVDGLIDRTVPLVQPSACVGDTSVVFLDAREWNEYSVSHIMDAVAVGYDAFSLDSLAGIPKDAQIVVYCSVGYRSEKIGEQLLEAGFNDVQNLYGGIFHWVNTGNTVYTDGHPTEEVHAYNSNWGQWLEEKSCKKVYE